MGHHLGSALRVINTDHLSSYYAVFAERHDGGLLWTFPMHQHHGSSLVSADQPVAPHFGLLARVRARGTTLRPGRRARDLHQHALARALSSRGHSVTRELLESCVHFNPGETLANTSSRRSEVAPQMLQEPKFEQLVCIGRWYLAEWHAFVQVFARTRPVVGFVGQVCHTTAQIWAKFARCWPKLLSRSMFRRLRRNFGLEQATLVNASVRSGPPMGIRKPAP